MEKKIKLKPCPFCGNEPKIEFNESIGYVSYYVKCINLECNVEVYTFDFNTKEEAIEAWNNRVDGNSCVKDYNHNTESNSTGWSNSINW